MPTIVNQIDNKEVSPAQEPCEDGDNNSSNFDFPETNFNSDFDLGLDLDIGELSF
jgi:hypothetical protein